MSVEALLEQGHRGVLRLRAETEDEMHEEGAVEFPGALPQVATVEIDYVLDTIETWRDRVNATLREIVDAGGDISDVQTETLRGDRLVAIITYWAQPDAQQTD